MHLQKRLVMKGIRFQLIVLALLATLAGLTSCKEEVADIPVKSVTLSEQILDMPIGSSTFLLAEIEPVEATDRDLIWTSSNEEVVKVDEGGMIQAISVGKAVITATAHSGVRDRCAISVYASQMRVHAVSALHISCRAAVVGGTVVPPENVESRDVKKGIIFSASPDVDIEHGTWYTVDDKSLGQNSFSMQIKMLEPLRKYYFRAYGIIDDEIIALSPTISFITKALNTMVETMPATDIGSNTATLVAKLDLTDCAASNIGAGFILTKAGSPSQTVSVHGVADDAKSFSATVSDLTPDTLYDCKAYVKADNITYETNPVQFRTAK